MGFMIVSVACAGCKQLGIRTMITIDADHEPAIPIGGRPQPVCRQCFTFHNEGRIQRGLEPVPLHPKAYYIQKEG